MKHIHRIPAVLLSALVLAAVPAAQSLYGINGDLAGPWPVVYEFTGPPDPAFCSYPNGPNLWTFPAVGGAVCPGLAPFPLPFDGDITADEITDLVYAADVFTIARYASNGAFVDSFPSPLAITGMGIDPFGPLLWITDGVTYGAIVPPPVHGCLGGPPPFVMGPWPVPFPLGFPGPITDIAWDPATGTLLSCDLAGFVASFVPGPAPVPGPYGVFPVVPGVCPTLMPALTGIDFDHALPGSGVFYVTDGFLVAYLTPGGGPAPTTRYTPLNCAPVPAPPISGLAFASRALPYGQGVDNAGLPAPRIGSIGQTISPNPGFVVTLSGSIPGALATLILGDTALCPPFPIAGVRAYVFDSSKALTVLGSTTVDSGGNAFLSMPVPPLLAGLQVFEQWVVVTPFPSLQVSEGLLFTGTLP